MKGKKITVFVDYTGGYDSLRERRIKRLAKKYNGRYEGWGDGSDGKTQETTLIYSFDTNWNALNFVGVGVHKGDFVYHPFNPD